LSKWRRARGGFCGDFAKGRAKDERQKTKGGVWETVMAVFGGNSAQIGGNLGRFVKIYFARVVGDFIGQIAGNFYRR
jgi:hypothetical protein